MKLAERARGIAPDASGKTPTIYVLGLGAVGLPLAVFLHHAGRNVVGVRTRAEAGSETSETVTIRDGLGGGVTATLKVVPLGRLPSLDGIAVITAKAFANPAIAAALEAMQFTGPLVILQNGLGVENPFPESQFDEIYRGVLYLTSQVIARHDVQFRTVASCPIGVVEGSATGLAHCVSALTTSQLPFHADVNISQEVWKKVIINSVFNSICPLLDIDNGVFVRDADAAVLAREIVRECLALATAHAVTFTEEEVMEQIMRISRGSDGVAISTLQDIRRGGETEIDALNLALARLASSAKPRIDLTRTEFLGRLIVAKSRCHRAGLPQRSTA